jgi:hypothetical protein
VGADSDDDNGPDSGSAYIFKREGTNWIEYTKLIALDGSAGDSFGYKYISINGNYAIVGAIGDDDYGDNSGSAYIFSACPTSDFITDCHVDFLDFAVLSSAWLSNPGDDNWNQDCDISELNDNVIDLLDLKVFAENWLK